MPPVSVSKHTEHSTRPQVKRREIRTRTSSGYPVSGASVTPGSGESFPSNIQGSGDNSMCMPTILPESSVIQRSVPVHEITQVGLRSQPAGSATHEAPTTTFSFVRSDKPVYITVSIRPFSPCHSTEAMAGSIVSHIRNPYPAIPGRIYDFHGRLYSVLWRHMGNSQIVCFWTRSERQLHINVLELKSVILALQHWVLVLQGHYVMIATDCCSLYQQTGWDPFPRPVAAGSRSVSVSVSGQTHSGLPQSDSRPFISAKPAHHNRVESPP